MGKDTMGHYEVYELQGGNAVAKEVVHPAEAALHLEVHRLQSALAVERKRREEAEADNARMREALEKLRDMQIVETLPIIEAALRPGKSEGGE